MNIMQSVFYTIGLLTVSVGFVFALIKITMFVHRKILNARKRKRNTILYLRNFRVFVHDALFKARIENKSARYVKMVMDEGEKQNPPFCDIDLAIDTVHVKQSEMQA